MLSRWRRRASPSTRSLQLIGRPAGSCSISARNCLPTGKAAFTLIGHDLDRQGRYPRLKYAYTGMFWRKQDRPMIRELHQRLDEYWDRHVLVGRAAN